LVRAGFHAIISGMTPPELPPFIPQIRLYQNWLARACNLRFDSYDALWRWSVTDLDAFWQSVWDYFELQSPTPHRAAFCGGAMPHARWFEGAQVNYVQQVMRHVSAAHSAGQPAMIACNEQGQWQEISWPALQAGVSALARQMQALGVQRGDRVAAYLPNIPEAMMAFMACASLGAVWSICSPDMGTPAVLDRFQQIEPKLLVAVDGVYYGGRAMDRSAVVQALREGLPSVQQVLLLQTPFATKLIADCVHLTPATGLFDSKDPPPNPFEPLALPFDHPLWIVYSSGTTGLPKPIVHGHGGVMLAHLALKTLHNDVGCSYAPNSFGERFHWYSSTGWVMWNAQMSGLLNGSTLCLYDGNPSGNKDAPDWHTLWRFAAQAGATWFGAGAAFYANCMKAGVSLQSLPELKRVRALGSTGSPLGEDAQNYFSQQFKELCEKSQAPSDAGPPQGANAPRTGEAGAPSPAWGSAPRAAQARGGDSRDAGPPQGASAPSGGSAPRAAGERGGNIWWCNISGGTDFCGAFIGGHRELPQVPGQMQARLLGCAVEAWDDQGHSVTAQVGELVCTQPIPSMPLYFWNDAGHARYLSSYFDMYPGVWRHGDWLQIKPDGQCIIYGRSDATINRQGLRMGTSEIYSAVERLPEVQDSMVVDLEYLGRESFMPLFVVLQSGCVLDDGLKTRINNAIKTALSPRFIPNLIVQAPEIPRTLTGKKQELPIKKLMLGHPLEKVVNPDAMANPGCLGWYAAFAKQQNRSA
jgi:acetoacetyl-CoA synthetase